MATSCILLSELIVNTPSLEYYLRAEPIDCISIVGANPQVSLDLVFNLLPYDQMYLKCLLDDIKVEDFQILVAFPTYASYLTELIVNNPYLRDDVLPAPDVILLEASTSEPTIPATIALLKPDLCNCQIWNGSGCPDWPDPTTGFRDGVVNGLDLSTLLINIGRTNITIAGTVYQVLGSHFDLSGTGTIDNLAQQIMFGAWGGGGAEGTCWFCPNSDFPLDANPSLLYSTSTICSASYSADTNLIVKTALEATIIDLAGSVNSPELEKEFLVAEDKTNLILVTNDVDLVLDSLPPPDPILCGLTTNDVFLSIDLLPPPDGILCDLNTSNVDLVLDLLPPPDPILCDLSINDAFLSVDFLPPPDGILCDLTTNDVFLSIDLLPPPDGILCDLNTSNVDLVLDLLPPPEPILCSLTTDDVFLSIDFLPPPEGILCGLTTNDADIVLGSLLLPDGILCDLTTNDATISIDSLPPPDPILCISNTNDVTLSIDNLPPPEGILCGLVTNDADIVLGSLLLPDGVLCDLTTNDATLSVDTLPPPEGILCILTTNDADIVLGSLLLPEEILCGLDTNNIFLSIDSLPPPEGILCDLNTSNVDIVLGSLLLPEEILCDLSTNDVFLSIDSLPPPEGILCDLNTSNIDIVLGSLLLPDGILCGLDTNEVLLSIDNLPQPAGILCDLNTSNVDLVLDSLLLPDGILCGLDTNEVLLSIDTLPPPEEIVCISTTNDADIVLGSLLLPAGILCDLGTNEVFLSIDNLPQPVGILCDSNADSIDLLLNVELDPSPVEISIYNGDLNLSGNWFIFRTEYPCGLTTNDPDLASSCLLLPETTTDIILDVNDATLAYETLVPEDKTNLILGTNDVDVVLSSLLLPDVILCDLTTNDVFLSIDNLPLPDAILCGLVTNDLDIVLTGLLLSDGILCDLNTNNVDLVLDTLPAPDGILCDLDTNNVDLLLAALILLPEEILCGLDTNNIFLSIDSLPPPEGILCDLNTNNVDLVTGSSLLPDGILYDLNTNEVLLSIDLLPLPDAILCGLVTNDLDIVLTGLLLPDGILCDLNTNEALLSVNSLPAPDEIVCDLNTNNVDLLLATLILLSDGILCDLSTNEVLLSIDALPLPDGILCDLNTNNVDLVTGSSLLPEGILCDLTTNEALLSVDSLPAPDGILCDLTTNDAFLSIDSLPLPDGVLCGLVTNDVTLDINTLLLPDGVLCDLGVSSVELVLDSLPLPDGILCDLTTNDAFLSIDSLPLPDGVLCGLTANDITLDINTLLLASGVLCDLATNEIFLSVDFLPPPDGILCDLVTNDATLNVDSLPPPEPTDFISISNNADLDLVTLFELSGLDLVLATRDDVVLSVSNLPNPEIVELITGIDSFELLTSMNLVAEPLTEFTLSFLDQVAVQIDALPSFVEILTAAVIEDVTLFPVVDLGTTQSCDSDLSLASILHENFFTNPPLDAEAIATRATIVDVADIDFRTNIPIDLGLTDLIIQEADVATSSKFYLVITLAEEATATATISLESNTSTPSLDPLVVLDPAVAVEPIAEVLDAPIEFVFSFEEEDLDCISDIYATEDSFALTFNLEVAGLEDSAAEINNILVQDFSVRVGLEATDKTSTLITLDPNLMDPDLYPEGIVIESKTTGYMLPAQYALDFPIRLQEQIRYPAPTATSFATPVDSALLPVKYSSGVFGGCLMNVAPFTAIANRQNLTARLAATVGVASVGEYPANAIPAKATIFLIRLSYDDTVSQLNHLYNYSNAGNDVIRNSSNYDDTPGSTNFPTSNSQFITQMASTGAADLSLAAQMQMTAPLNTVTTYNRKLLLASSLVRHNFPTLAGDTITSVATDFNYPSTYTTRPTRARIESTVAPVSTYVDSIGVSPIYTTNHMTLMRDSDFAARVDITSAPLTSKSHKFNAVHVKKNASANSQHLHSSDSFFAFLPLKNGVTSSYARSSSPTDSTLYTAFTNTTVIISGTTAYKVTLTGASSSMAGYIALGESLVLRITFANYRDIVGGLVVIDVPVVGFIGSGSSATFSVDGTFYWFFTLLNSTVYTAFYGIDSFTIEVRKDVRDSSWITTASTAVYLRPIFDLSLMNNSEQGGQAQWNANRVHHLLSLNADRNLILGEFSISVQRTSSSTDSWALRVVLNKHTTINTTTLLVTAVKEFTLTGSSAKLDITNTANEVNFSETFMLLDTWLSGYNSNNTSLHSYYSLSIEPIGVGIEYKVNSASIFAMNLDSRVGQVITGAKLLVAATANSNETLADYAVAESAANSYLNSSVFTIAGPPVYVLSVVKDNYGFNLKYMGKTPDYPSYLKNATNSLAKLESTNLGETTLTIDGDIVNIAAPWNPIDATYNLKKWAQDSEILPINGANGAYITSWPISNQINLAAFTPTGTGTTPAFNKCNLVTSFNSVSGRRAAKTTKTAAEQHFYAAYNVANPLGDFTYVVVKKNNVFTTGSAGPNQTHCILTQLTNNKLQGLGEKAGSPAVIFVDEAGATQAHIAVNPVWTSGTVGVAHIVVASCSNLGAPTPSLRVDGQKVSTVYSGAQTLTQNKANGDYALSDVIVGGSRQIDSEVAEMLVFNRALELSELQLVEGYLAHKYSLLSSLPADHPFKTTFPNIAVLQSVIQSDPSSYVASIDVGNIGKLSAPQTWLALYSVAATYQTVRTVTNSTADHHAPIVTTMELNSLIPLTVYGVEGVFAELAVANIADADFSHPKDQSLPTAAVSVVLDATVNIGVDDFTLVLDLGSSEIPAELSINAPNLLIILPLDYGFDSGAPDLKSITAETGGPDADL